MSRLYTDYIWKDGAPVGVGAIEENGAGYKIIADPYRKRISIERYSNDQFEETIYDSIFLDFRHLKPSEQNAWQRVITEEKPDCMTCIIKNQDDRVLFREEYTYENGICRSCRIDSPQGIHLSSHRMYYTSLGDPFDGVVLYDCNGHPVMFKKYACDPKTLDFLELMEENWTPGPILKNLI